jgi:hypothetical protein
VQDHCTSLNLGFEIVSLYQLRLNDAGRVLARDTVTGTLGLRAIIFSSQDTVDASVDAASQVVAVQQIWTKSSLPRLFWAVPLADPDDTVSSAAK